MASNNTDWEFGETRDNQRDWIVPAKVKDGTTATIQAGDPVHFEKGLTEGGTYVVSGFAATSDDDGWGVCTHTPVNGVAAKAGDIISVLIRGITRVRFPAAGAIPLGKLVHIHDREITAAGASGTSTNAIGINVGGTLAATDTGLVYVNFVDRGNWV